MIVPGRAPRGTALAATAAAAALLAGALGAAPAAAQESVGAPGAVREANLREMGWWIVHLSAVNAANGVNLDRGQIRALRDLARRVESAGARVPDATVPLAPELAGVREAYRELREVLLAGRAVPPALRARVAAARAAESRAIRATLTPPRRDLPARGSCLRCHGGSRDLDAPVPPAGTWPPAEVAEAHTRGLFGPLGLATLAALAPEVDRRLTDAQRAVFSDFSCCLVPPSGLADPVRVGQASIPDWAADLLDRGRAVPERLWPGWRDRVAGHIGGLLDAVRPGVTEAEKAAARARIASALDGARGLPDVEYALARDGIAARLAGDRTSPDHKLKRGFFLLSPGAVAIYDALLARPEPVVAAQPADDPAPAPAAPAAATEAESLAREAAALLREARARLLLQEARLTPAQAGALLPLARRAAALAAAHEEESAPVRRLFEVALREFREEDLRDRGFTPEVERRVGGLERRVEEMGRAHSERLEAIEREAEAVLTQEQRALRAARAYDLMVGLAPRTEAGETARRLREVLEDRFGPACPFARALSEPMAEGLLRELARTGPGGEDPPVSRARAR